ncbi:hypothetical protein [Campylobacter pinnipediorum]|uniref:hypothetical protein n=1 Tax=Campylobacter pinnipediorum TaxID=1965231 RepID=UPI00084D06FD|nr:hypothetical protein [Campylobacter pinnipediorum]
MNSGVIRGNKLYKAGTILTRKDIAAETPFLDTIILTKIKGSNIFNIIKDFESIEEDKYNHSFLFIVSTDYYVKRYYRLKHLK